MPSILGLIVAILLFLPAVASAQAVTIAWDAPAVPPSRVDEYRLRVDDKLVGATPGLSYVFQALPSGTVTVSAYYGSLGVESPGAPLGSAAPAPGPTPTPTPPPQPSTSCTDASGALWTIDSNRHTLRNGIWIAGGLADQVVCRDRVYVFSGVWFVLDTNPERWTPIIGQPPAATTPLPAPGVSVGIVPTTCRISSPNKPDSRTGWGVQFTVDGVNVGGRDTTAPFERTFPFTPGPHVGQAIWTKTGVPSITVSITVQGCQ